MDQDNDILITTEILNTQEITGQVMKDSYGALVTFTGVTRRYTGGRKVLYLEYEAYRPMADLKLREIAEDMRQRWNVGVSIGHRLGRLEIGETSLIVAVGSPHRKDAFEACQYSVDRIKQIVPIWKKEYFEGGETWIGNPEEFAPSTQQKIVEQQ